MAKYTELFAEYLESGGELPAAFAEIDGFEDAFIQEYCDKEIGFETEALFYIKLEAKANIVIPIYKKKFEALDQTLTQLSNPIKTRQRTFEGGERKADETVLPINSLSATPSRVSKSEGFTDTETITDEGNTVDEAIKKVEFVRDTDNEYWSIFYSCLKEFDNLFMKVY